MSAFRQWWFLAILGLLLVTALFHYMASDASGPQEGDDCGEGKKWVDISHGEGEPELSCEETQ